MQARDLLDDGGSAFEKANQLALKSAKTATDLQWQLFQDTAQIQDGRELIKGLSTSIFLLSTTVFVAYSHKGLPVAKMLEVFKKITDRSVSQGELTKEDSYKLYCILQAVTEDKDSFETALDSLENDPMVLAAMMYNLMMMYTINCGKSNYVISTTKILRLYVKNFVKNLAKNEPVVKMEQEKFSRRLQAEQDFTELALTFLELVAPFNKAKDNLESIPVFDSDTLFHSEKVLNFIESESQEELLRGLCNVVSITLLYSTAIKPLAMECKRLKKSLIPKTNRLLLGKLTTAEGLACAFDLLISLTEKDTFFRKSEVRFDRQLKDLNDKPDIIFALVSLFFILLSVVEINAEEAIHDIREKTNDSNK